MFYNIIDKNLVIILIAALFSRAAVVCMTLGFITLLTMVIVAIYKSHQPNDMINGTGKTSQGMFLFYFCFPLSNLFM